jgi:predicted Zn finger-like uncharacterized protein
MIVDCPSCHTQFQVPDQAVPPMGRKLRCSACGHIWLFIPPIHDVDTDSNTGIHAGIQAGGIAVPGFLNAPQTDGENRNFTQILEQAMAKLGPPEAAPVQAKVPVWAKWRDLYRIDRAQFIGYLSALVVFTALLGLCWLLRGVVMSYAPFTAVLFQLVGH